MEERYVVEKVELLQNTPVSSIKKLAIILSIGHKVKIKPESSRI